MTPSGTGRISDDERNRDNQLESEQYFKYVFDHLSVCLFFIDLTLDGRFRFAGLNPAGEKAIGMRSQQVKGKYVEEVFAPDLARKLVGNYRRCVETGTPITYEEELTLPGGYRYFRSNLIPCRNDAGQIYRIVGESIDTTELKRTQEEAIRAQRLESVGLMAAEIAHDCNSLVGGILAQAELAESELDAGSSPKEAIQAINTIAIRTGEIVRQLVTYAGQESATRESTDLSLLIQEVLQLLKPLVSKNATIRVTLSDKPAVVRANRAQLRQVILNLVTNASEALGDREGVISISINPLTDGEMADHSLTPARAGWFRLTISDTGRGMKPEVLSRIFDPFYTTKSSGRGLGLTAVQRIVKSHGGTINVTSVPGQGSRFEILLASVPG
jgi:PAS domain S-box-containing protein